MRINKYLAAHKYCTRKEADELIEKGCVSIGGHIAVLGDQVAEGDVVEVRKPRKTFRYFAYYKPRGIITHSPQKGEKEITEIIPIQGVFPVGRLDKDSYGLIILTDDGRITEPLLSPTQAHEKEYEVHTLLALPKNFKTRMEKGVDIGGYRTKPCAVHIMGTKVFRIILTEGKKHQIRRMCGAFGASVTELKRIRIMNISLGSLQPGKLRPIQGAELAAFLSSIGIIH